MEPRSAAALGTEFPYTSATLCYIEVAEDGTVAHGKDAGDLDAFAKQMRAQQGWDIATSSGWGGSSGSGTYMRARRKSLTS